MSNNSGLDIKIKSDSSYIFSKSIKVSSLDIQAFKQYIDYNIASNPLIYKGEMYSINVDGLDYGTPDSLISFYKEAEKIMFNSGIIPIGIKNCHPKDKPDITENMIGVYIENKNVANVLNKEDAVKKSMADKNTLVYTGVLRGGANLVNKNGDIIIIGSTNHGSEVHTSGNLIVLGNASGKLIAGIGNPDSIIYTSFLDASIISIDGVFKIIEEDSIAYRRESTLVQMKNGSLKFSLIGAHNEWKRIWYTRAC